MPWRQVACLCHARRYHDSPHPRTSSSAGTAGRVRSLLSRAAQAGQVDAAVDLAFLLESGADDGPKDPAEAERLYLKARP